MLTCSSSHVTENNGFTYVFQDKRFSNWIVTSLSKLSLTFPSSQLRNQFLSRKFTAIAQRVDSANIHPTAEHLLRNVSTRQSPDFIVIEDGNLTII